MVHMLSISQMVTKLDMGNAYQLMQMEGGDEYEAGYDTR